ncbi:MAG: LytTR family DNA-binding domain-containing protein [Bacteroidota bacterium]
MSKNIRTLLIDDEAGALMGLRGMLLEFCPQIDIVGEAMTVSEALQIMAQLKPDLIFLDIEMSPYNGFDFIKMTPQYEFGVIFSTAYPQFAIEAINMVQPWAYLVKPYSIDTLLQAINIAIRKVQTKPEAPKEPTTNDFSSIILQDQRKGNIILRTKEILYCKSDGATIDIYTLRNGKTERFILYRTMKELESQLPEGFFCRVHHSFIVNLSFVERYECTRQSRTIYLNNQTEIPISIQKADYFIQKMSDFLR